MDTMTFKSLGVDTATARHGYSDASFLLHRILHQKVRNVESLRGKIRAFVLVRYCYNHLEWPPKVMGLIHLSNVFQKEVIAFIRLWEECTQEESRLIIREENMGATEDQDLTIQRRSLKR